MARHKRRVPRKQFKHPAKKQPASVFILLDKFSATDIERWAIFKDQILKFHWDFYSNLAYQRSKISDEIKKSLLEATQKSFPFEKYQRAVKYRHALEPFSVVGSVIDPGGRFNIGDINASQFLLFPALYLAADKDTALQELLSQKIEPGQKDRTLDFALTNPESIASISVSGFLNSLISLKQPERLQPFVDLIKDFSIPDSLKEISKKIGLPEPELIKTVPKLVEALMAPYWREWPMQCDVPFSSQIFGQLVADAGIEGILYESKFTGKACLAIFPQNFDETSGSFIQLDDEAPAEIKIRRLDAKVWHEIERPG